MIWDSGMREFPPRLPQFPPRLPHQPIFYPVATKEYAAQIARDWNPRDKSSGITGFMTQFGVPTPYLENLSLAQSARLRTWSRGVLDSRRTTFGIQYFHPRNDQR